MEPRSDGRIHNRFSYLLGNFLEAKENADTEAISELVDKTLKIEF
jgi:hypothetical protein